MRLTKCLRRGHKRGGRLETNCCLLVDFASKLTDEFVGRKEEEDSMEVWVAGPVCVGMEDPKVDLENRLPALRLDEDVRC